MKRIVLAFLLAVMTVGSVGCGYGGGGGGGGQPPATPGY
jgi:hypothetical protein